MDGNQTHYDDHFVVYTNTESFCRTPEINILSNVNYISKDGLKNI